MSRLRVRQADWESVRDQLASTFLNDELAIKADVKSGNAFCWWLGEKTAAITRREGGELVVMCLAGVDGLAAAESIKAAAKRAGCKTVRFHTHRPAMGRLLKPAGFELAETIFRCEL